MKLLIVGASGLVGSNLAHAARATGHSVVGTYHTTPIPDGVPLALDDESALGKMVNAECPDSVVCCSAWSWVDGCEADPGRAFRQNRDQPAKLAGTAYETGARFVHFSTSYVFDGRHGPYTENDAPDPQSVYARSKLEGERAVLEATAGEALILRTMGVFGPEPQRKNFVLQILDNLRAGRRMRVPVDQIGNASYAPDLAEATLRLLEQGEHGVWNLAGPDPNLNRADFARFVARAFRLDATLFDFLPTTELTQAAARPLHGGLIIDKAREKLGWSPRGLDQIPWNKLASPPA